MAISYFDPATGRTKTTSSFREVERAVSGRSFLDRNMPGESDAEREARERENRAGGGVSGSGFGGGGGLGSAGGGATPRDDPDASGSRAGDDDRGGSQQQANVKTSGTPAVGDVIRVGGVTLRVTSVDPRTGQIQGTDVNRSPGDPNYVRSVDSASLQRGGFTPPQTTPGVDTEFTQAPILAGREEDANAIALAIRNREISLADGLRALAPLTREGTTDAAQAYLNSLPFGTGGADGGTGTGGLGDTTQPQIPSTLSSIFGGETGGIGLPDLARQITSQTGIAPGFRDFVEGRIGQQVLPFALSAAQAGGDIAGNVQDPQEFANFLGEQGFSPIGRTLRSAGDFLRGSGGVGQGRDFLNDLLLGPSGSVGSELFSPIISALTQGTGRRFLPGLGSTARSATSSALNRTLANQPTQFRTAPDFIDFLAQQGLI